MLPGMTPGPGQIGAQYRAQAVNFDGSNDYLTRGAGLTGLTDSKAGTVSFWVNMNGGDGSEQVIFGVGPSGSADVYFGVFRFSTNKLLVFGYNTSGTLILAGVPSSTTTTAATGWTHFLCSFNLADSGQRSIYINDALDQSWSTYSNQNIDHTSTQFAVGSRPNAANKLNADLADVFWWEGLYTDFSTAANRRLFIDGNGKPVTPVRAVSALGTPDLALFAREPNWHTNQGGGGGLTENGALTDASSSPSD